MVCASLRIRRSSWSHPNIIQLLVILSVAYFMWYSLVRCTMRSSIQFQRNHNSQAYQILRYLILLTSQVPRTIGSLSSITLLLLHSSESKCKALWCSLVRCTMRSSLLLHDDCNIEAYQILRFLILLTSQVPRTIGSLSSITWLLLHSSVSKCKALWYSLVRCTMRSSLLLHDDCNIEAYQILRFLILLTSQVPRTIGSLRSITWLLLHSSESKCKALWCSLVRCTF